MSRHRLSAAIVVLVVAALGYWLEQSGFISEAEVPTGSAADQLAELVIRVEDTGAHYRRSDWPHWVSQGDSCDTRQIVLQRDGDQVRTDRECRAVAGRWISPFDDVTLRSSRDVDIDHLVPLAEAARSGTRHWDRERRQRFANDLDNLVAVSASSNRAKGDSDPGRWRPAERSYWCVYATRWIGVKSSYQLTVDQAEHAALVQMLNTCPSS